MMALVSSDELAKDVTGAEALLERHQVCLVFFLLSCLLHALVNVVLQLIKARLLYCSLYLSMIWT